MAKFPKKQQEPEPVKPVATAVPTTVVPVTEVPTTTVLVKRNIFGHPIVQDPLKSGIGHGDDSRKAKV